MRNLTIGTFKIINWYRRINQYYIPLLITHSCCSFKPYFSFCFPFLNCYSKYFFKFNSCAATNFFYNQIALLAEEEGENKVFMLYFYIIHNIPNVGYIFNIKLVMFIFFTNSEETYLHENNSN